MEDQVVDKAYDLRRRVLDGEDIPAEDYKEIIEALRGGRMSAAEKKSGKGKSTVKEVDLDELFG